MSLSVINLLVVFFIVVVEKEPQGPSALLDKTNERKLVVKTRFCTYPDQCAQLSEQLKLFHKFKANISKAGKDWWYAFLEKNVDLSVRKS